ncbi:hypothetical protein AQUCO_00200167v1 [Aquilegia coerulea]|uniref:protein-serine/threonine phosphatase n=1 Tax=Aquilegia coerulea TaxID=218851 RepID=A0A2G5F1X2_AQUCA|nr:hypothetical protein AQUCO_00200167v1 [Aquilegia coerulea]
MAELCEIVATDEIISDKTTFSCDPIISLEAKRKRMERRRFKILSGGMAAQPENSKRQKPEVRLERDESSSSFTNSTACDVPKYGVTSVCGQRREMEDAVAIHPSFCHQDSTNLHFFGVYDGHGCSHVARTCKDRLHQIVKEEIEENKETGSQWKQTMERSFSRVDKEVLDWSAGSCSKCQFQLPKCDAAGSTAVVSIVTSEKIITANCGDSRAVLCRGGKAIPLSSDHKPDRLDERLRIEAAGGHVIYWDVPRVVGDLGVLAMSRAIGDDYLKPYVCSEPEVTITDRTVEDECLILASDGLWDVLSNETACCIARMCLKNGQVPPCLPSKSNEVEGSDKACVNAALLLTKLALVRNTTDNVSVIVVDLRRKQHDVAEHNSNKL